MNAAHAIERAEHALRTGQPNLAITYMRRAAVLVAQEREAARRAILRARLARASPAERIGIAAEEIAAAFKPFVDFITSFGTETGPNSYALAGPSKGGN